VLTFIGTSVDRLAGTQQARDVRRGIQYDPAQPV
jgi:hypothetical protein